MRTIAIIGAGLMGHGIAQVLAVHGCSVTLMDLKAEILAQAKEHIRANLTFLAGRGLGIVDDIEPTLQRIACTNNLQEAVIDAELVIEAVVEKLAIKQKLFMDLDELCSPETILATNTSVISISEIARPSHHRGRIVGTHFWNPPYLIPLVEVIKGEQTTEETMEQTFTFLKAVGKHPVKVQRDVPGFVGNRLQHALWREALSIVENGIADAATVDECIKFGFGLRLPILGPLENVDMVGTDLTLNIHSYLLRHLECSPEPSELLIAKVKHNELGFKTGKGYQDWTPEKARRSRERLQEYLITVIKSKGEKS
jgi:3-hydroxybutyryl-CoA dehydrogenase